MEESILALIKDIKKIKSKTFKNRKPEFQRKAFNHEFNDHTPTLTEGEGVFVILVETGNLKDLTL